MRVHSFKEQAVFKKSGGEIRNVAYIAQELVTGGELLRYIATGAFSESVCKYFFSQMLDSVEYIHSQGIAHRDLKVENILLSKQDNFRVKIIDFGLACPLKGTDGSGILHDVLGTRSSMAPEISALESYQGRPVDIYALGVILFFMHSGHRPFESSSMDDYRF